MAHRKKHTKLDFLLHILNTNESKKGEGKERNMIRGTDIEKEDTRHRYIAPFSPKAFMELDNPSLVLYKNR